MSLADVKKKTTLSQAMNALRQEGFKTQFEVKDGKLKSDDSSSGYATGDVIIKEHYRFEGESNPADMSILYAVETDDGEKGVVVNGYGTYGSEQVADFMAECKEEMDNKDDAPADK